MNAVLDKLEIETETRLMIEDTKRKVLSPVCLFIGSFIAIALMIVAKWLYSLI